jgi:hypothetical protein
LEFSLLSLDFSKGLPKIFGTAQGDFLNDLAFKPTCFIKASKMPGIELESSGICGLFLDFCAISDFRTYAVGRFLTGCTREKSLKIQKNYCKFVSPGFFKS